MIKNSSKWSRLAGQLGLAIFLCAVFSEGYVKGSILDPDDAANTVANVKASVPLLNSALFAEGGVILFEIGYMTLLFLLLRHVRPTIANIAFAFRLITIGFLTLNWFHSMDLLQLAHGSAGDLSDSIITSLSDHAHIYQVALVTMGPHLLLLGWIVKKAHFAPNWIGNLLMLAGIAYLINSVTYFFAPPINEAFGILFFLPAAIGELSLSFWLLFKGIRSDQNPLVNEQSETG